MSFVGRQGVEPWTKRGLKARRSTAELTAPALYSQGLFSHHRCFLSVGRAGVEPAHLLLIRQPPSPFGHRPVVVAREGTEPPTSPLWAGRSNHLSYLAMVGHLGVGPSS